MTHFGTTVPVLPGFWSDPTICRVDGDFYLANSSFEYFPGAPVHHSTDLIAWTQLGSVITRPEQSPLVGALGSQGTFGCTLRHHDGRFWFVTTNIAQVMDGQQLYWADSPEGPWSDPMIVPVGGIDPDLAWDDDGTCYLTWCRMGAIAQVRIDTTTGAVLSEPTLLWSGTGMRNPEGPHLYHVGDWWYLLIAEGGTGQGHAVSVARSRSPQGTFEPGPANPILTHRSTGHPVQAVGHADLVEGPDGWYAVYHGTRPRGTFPQFHLLGRETMLARVAWVDGWPAIVETDDLVTASDHAFTDTFASGLDHRWVCPGGTLAGVETSDCLELTAVDGHRPVVTRVTDHDWSATLTLDVSRGRARVLLRLDDDHWYGLDVSPGGTTAVASVGFATAEVTGPQVDDPTRVTVRIGGHPPLPTGGFPAPQPDLVGFDVLVDGDWRPVVRWDGRYLSTEVAGGFTGRMVGVQSLEGTVRVELFAYEGRPAPEIAAF